MEKTTQAQDSGKNPAFPGNIKNLVTGTSGLEIRTYLVGQAITGMAENVYNKRDAKDATKRAAMLADAILGELYG